MVLGILAIEMGNLTIERSLRLVDGEWQTDAFPGSGSIVGIDRWLAYIPGMTGYREWNRHAEVVVVAGNALAVFSCRCTFYQMEKWGSVGRVSCRITSLDDMMALYAIFGSLLVVVQRTVHYIVGILTACLIAFCIGINQEVLGNALLDDEIIEACGIVILSREVDGCSGWDVHVGSHILGSLVVGIIVILLSLDAAVVASRAIYTIAHVSVFLRCDAGRIEGWRRLEILSPEEEVVHRLSTFLCVLVELWEIVACSRLLGLLRCSLIILCARLIDGMCLVVTGSRLAIVWQITVLTRTEIGDTRILARNGIGTMSILIVAVGIIIIDIFQSCLVCIRTIAFSCPQIVTVQIVGYLTIQEVILAIGSDIAFHIIYDRLSRRC